MWLGREINALEMVIMLSGLWCADASLLRNLHDLTLLNRAFFLILHPKTAKAV